MGDKLKPSISVNTSVGIENASLSFFNAVGKAATEGDIKLALASATAMNIACHNLALSLTEELASQMQDDNKRGMN